MTSRRHAPSDVSDRYEVRRDYARSEVGRRDNRGWEDDLEYRSRPAPRDRERTTTIVKDEVRVKERSPPDFLREDYGRTSSGPMVLRAREREDFEYAARSHHRSPSPEPERRIEREEIIVRKEHPEARRPAPPPARDYEREEIIVRRGEQREAERVRPPPAREVERDEVIIRRDERGGNPRYAAVYDRDDLVNRRPPPRDDFEREEIIIRRERDDSPPPSLPRHRGRDDPYGLPRAVSHERERSRIGRPRADSDTDEIIFRRDEREVGRHGRAREREEIIIRRRESRSPSPASSHSPSVRSPPEPPMINAPAIHQEIITHHRHIDHGYELALAPIPPPARTRPPSPPTPPQDEERIEIRRRGEKNGKFYDEDIIIDRNQSRSAPPTRDHRDEEMNHPSPAPTRRPAPPPERWYDSRDSRDLQEEAEYYNQRALERSYHGEGHRGSTADWAIVDVPPGTRRVRMDGAGGAAQEITWQRYNGVRRSKFMPDGSDEGYGSEISRAAPPSVLAPAPAPAPATGGEIGRRYGGVKDPKEGLWTEITKDLVVKEAISEAGYEFEETADFFYVIAYLKYDDIARLVGLSEDIRHARRKRMKEIDWERRLPPPEPARRPLAIEDIPSRPAPGPWDREEERLVEREWYRPRPQQPRW